MLDTINSFVEPYITKIIDLLQGFDPYIAAAAILVVAIFTIIGLFVFIKKFVKLFIFLAILGGAFYFVSTQTDIIPNYFETIPLISIKMLIFN